MIRPATRVTLLLAVGALATGAGTVLALVLTPPGRALLARTVTEGLNRFVEGSVQIGAVAGSFTGDLTLRRVVVRDNEGAIVLASPRIRVAYRPLNLLAGRIVLDGLEAERPVISIERRPAGRWNFEEVFHLGEGKKGGRPALVVFRGLRITDGAVRIAYPWPSTRYNARERDSVIAKARSEPGKVVVQRNGNSWRVLTLSAFNAHVPRLAISSPDRKPLRVEIDSLAADVSDPSVRLRDAQGSVEYQNDSLRFDFDRFALPATVARARGTASWPADTVLYDFAAEASQLDLVDLRFISPQFPAMTGSARVVAKWETAYRTRYELTRVQLQEGDERIEGQLVAVVDQRRGLGVRDLDLRLTRLNLDQVRGYLDTLPFDGWITGPVKASGYLDDLEASGDWLFEDAAVAGVPRNQFAFAGGIQTGGKDGLVFDSMLVQRGDFDLKTIRKLAPAVPLFGRLSADGTLNGPLRNATFHGVAVHQDEGRPPSRINGSIRLDTRDTMLAVDADVALDPLEFEGIRQSFPAIASRGALRGRMRLNGTLAAMQVHGTVAGDIGTVTANGGITVQPPRWGADSLQLEFLSLDLAALTGRGPATSFDGALWADGKIDTLVAPDGGLTLQVDRGRVREIEFSDIRAVLSVRDSLIRLDTLSGLAGGARLGGSGTLGWARPVQGQMRLEAIADSLLGFDAFVTTFAGAESDTIATPRPLDGQATLTMDLIGSLDTLTASADLEADGIVWRTLRVPELGAQGRWLGGTRPGMELHVATDSVAYSGRFYRALDATASGPLDSLNWGLRGEFGTNAGAAGAGQLITRDSLRTVAFDSLALNLPVRNWRLEAPASLTMGGGSPELSRLLMLASDGGGRLEMVGRIPWETEGDVLIDALGVDLRALAALLQAGSTDISGSLALRANVAGTRRAPLINGVMTVEDISVGDAHGPFVFVAMNYADRHLESRAELWRTGRPVMSVDAQLPIDLAFLPMKERRIEGPIMVRGFADSVELSLLEPLTRTIRSATGLLAADVRIEGTWARPSLAGALDLKKGAFDVPALNQRYSSIELELALGGDSILLRYATATSGNGRLELAGHVRLEELTRPILDLDIRARRFRAINRPNFLSLTATGQLSLKGPVRAPTLTGSAKADEGVLYFADLISKRVIDLEDPANLEFVDTTLLRTRRLTASLTEQLTRDLIVQDLNVGIGDNFWLRSNEANIKLEGDVRVNKSREGYRVDGNLSAVRGSYTLAIGPVTRDFDVIRGNVRYFGTPDLNAQLDIEARHLVRTNRNQELPIIADISGTLLDPRLSLRSEGATAAVSQTDLVSYLLTGAPASEATLSSAALTNIALSATASELERTLISDLGLPIDMLEVRSSVGNYGANSSTVAQLQLAAGVQLGRKTFLSFNAGFCASEIQSLDYRNFGIGLEYRLSNEWKAQLSAEPAVRLCGATGAAYNAGGTFRYQLGGDILWQREF